MFKKITSIYLILILCLASIQIDVSAEVLTDISFSDISVEEQHSITRDLTLITHVNGVETYEWSSSSENIVSSTGKVTRPSVGENDAEVTLTVTSKINGDSAAFILNVKAFANNKEVLGQAKKELDFTDLSIEAIDNVTQPISLPNSWLYDTMIYWTSTDENIISIIGTTGNVRKPPKGEGFANVVLQAHIVKEDTSINKYFFVRVPEENFPYRASSKLEESCNSFERTFLSVQNIVDLRSNLVIPQSESNDVSITMLSDNVDALSDTGEIKRSLTDDKIVNVVFFFSCGYETTSRSYPVVVRAIERDSILKYIEDDLNALVENLNSNYNLTKLSENLNLPLKGNNQTVFSFVSSDASIMTNNGTISRKENSQNVILTVTGILNGETLTRAIPITILPKEQGLYSENSGTGLSGSGGTGSVTSKIDFPEDILPTAAFNDVPRGHWAYSPVSYLYGRGIISGVTEDEFLPDSLVTREQFVKMIIEASNYTINNYDTPFQDVHRSEWYYSHVATAYRNGLINGISDVLFGVGKPISRQDLSVIIYNVMMRMTEIPEITENGVAFKDSDDISDYAKNAVTELQQRGLIKGRGENVFCPKESLTRAEAAMVIYRLLTFR